MSDRDLRPLAARLLQNRGIRLVTLGTGQGERKRHDGGGFHPGMNHVIAVADESDLQTFELALMLDQGLAIGEHLARMVAIGERVDHRHRGIFGHLFDDLVAKGAHRDQIEPAV